jgi:hypothetical protein
MHVLASLVFGRGFSVRKVDEINLVHFELSFEGLRNRLERNLNEGSYMDTRHTESVSLSKNQSSHHKSGCHAVIMPC